MRKQLATPRHRVAIVATPGAPIFELAVPCEVFGTDRSDIVDPWYDARICSTGGEIVLASGFKAPAASLDAIADADTVVVPACRSVHERSTLALLDALRSAHARGARIASICSGAFVLAEAGLLDGLRATTHWMHADELARRYPAVAVDPSVLYVQQGRVFTSAGTAAGIDLCLELVRQDHGAAAAREVARRMVVPPHRAGGQAQYVRRPSARHLDVPEPRLLAWARAHAADDITVGHLAQQAGMSHRSLIRRFHETLGMTPQQWLLRERLGIAQELLESTSLPVDRVAAQSGLGSAANLRRHFSRVVGISPTSYRQTFSSRSSALGA